MNNVKKLDSVDLVKFIASILIVVLHSDLFLGINDVLHIAIDCGITRLCVPFFFITSAFFYFRKPLTSKNTKRYCIRLLLLYAVWFVISLPKTIFDRFICSEYSIGITIFRFIRSFFVTSTFSGSWFIISCVFCAVLYYGLSKINNKVSAIITFIICVVVYLWITFTSAYGVFIDKLGLSDFYDKYEMIFGNPFVSFLVGIPYFGLGKFFAENYQKNGLQKFSKGFCLTGSIVILVLFIIEVFICNKNGLSKSTDCYFMLLPFILFFFPLVLKWDVSLKNAKLLRIASTVVFFSHFLFLFATELAEWVFKITIPNFAKFAFAMICSLAFSFIVLKLQEKKGFHWLKYLY